MNEPYAAELLFGTIFLAYVLLGFSLTSFWTEGERDFVLLYLLLFPAHALLLGLFLDLRTWLCPYLRSERVQEVLWVLAILVALILLGVIH